MKTKSNMTVKIINNLILGVSLIISISILSCSLNKFANIYEEREKASLSNKMQEFGVSNCKNSFTQNIFTGLINCQ
jgi:hypothetical protein